MTWIKTAYFKSQFKSTVEYTLSLRLQYAVVVADGLGRSLNIHKVLLKSLLKCCVCVSSITVNSSLNLPKFDHCKFLLEFTGVVVVVVHKFDHCKIFPSVSRKSYHSLTP